MVLFLYIVYAVILKRRLFLEKIHVYLSLTFDGAIKTFACADPEFFFPGWGFRQLFEFARRGLRHILGNFII